jgi:hypothetical protein
VEQQDGTVTDSVSCGLWHMPVQCRVQYVMLGSAAVLGNPQQDLRSAIVCIGGSQRDLRGHPQPQPVPVVMLGTSSWFSIDWIGFGHGRRSVTLCDLIPAVLHPSSVRLKCIHTMSGLRLRN